MNSILYEAAQSKDGLDSILKVVLVVSSHHVRIAHLRASNLTGQFLLHGP